MKKATTIITFLAILLLASCCIGQNYSEQLTLADSLILSKPDSALQILKKTPMERLKNRADSAYYALLTTEAEYKNFIRLESDSLIRMAVEFYDWNKNTVMQVRSHYALGCVYENINNAPLAIKEYLTALSLANEIHDLRLLGLIYNGLGYVYYKQRFDDKADSIYKLAEAIGVQRQDTSLWGEALTNQGKILFYDKQYIQAEEKLVEALKVLGHFKADGIRADIAGVLSQLYGKIGQSEKSIQYAKQNRSFQRDSLRCYRAFLLLGDAYYRADKYDSATFFLNRSLLSSDYSTKGSAYMRLSDIAKEQGNLSASLQFERLYSAYKDSINLTSQKSEIVEAEHLVLLKQQQMNYESLLSEHRYYLIPFFAAAILLFYILHKRAKKKICNQQVQRAQAEKEMQLQYQSLQGELTQKEEQIVKLRFQIAEIDVSEKRKQALQEELEKMNKQRLELLKQTLQHSDVYNKMERILSDCKLKGRCKEFLTDDDWSKFAAEIDKKGVIFHLSLQYKLSPKEVQYCYLLLTDFPLTQRATLLQLSRQTPYRREHEILGKIGEEYQSGKLQKHLRRAMEE